MVADLKRLRRETESARTGVVPAYSSSASVEAAAPSAPQPLAEKPRALRKRVLLVIPALVVLLVLAYLLRPTLPPPRITGYTQLSHDGLAKTFGGAAVATVLTDGP